LNSRTGQQPCWTQMVILQMVVSVGIVGDSLMILEVHYTPAVHPRQHDTLPYIILNIKNCQKYINENWYYNPRKGNSI